MDLTVFGIYWYFSGNEIGYSKFKKVSSGTTHDDPQYDISKLIVKTYLNRTDILKENGSLLLHNLKLTDSGEYTVKLEGEKISTKKLVLKVTGHQGGERSDTELKIQSETIYGQESQSVLLNISYHFPRSSTVFGIYWDFSENEIGSCKFINCLAWSKFNESGCEIVKLFITSYKDRADIIKENGSLLLHNISLNDAGNYKVRLEAGTITTGRITLKVLQYPQGHTTEIWSSEANYIRLSISSVVVVLIICIIVLHFNITGPKYPSQIITSAEKEAEDIQKASMNMGNDLVYSEKM
ncbi:uncharacterized protein LOC122815816 [Protopterus annectens]|uniref:uncharacterized protein LOC122815816 n=1 Tax=Protopterus annectens TaxID=7888 RepID=UPI001CF9918B|nr:uncharacterized protein LOC122815816 [Protopterus annectens]